MLGRRNLSTPFYFCSWTLGYLGVGLFSPTHAQPIHFGLRVGRCGGLNLRCFFLNFYT
jgi:hypothetical protein